MSGLTVHSIIKAALAEVGFPDADVWFDEDPNGPVWVEGPPDEVIDKACDIANSAVERGVLHLAGEG